MLPRLGLAASERVAGAKRLRQEPSSAPGTSGPLQQGRTRPLKRSPPGARCGFSAPPSARARPRWARRRSSRDSSKADVSEVLRSEIETLDVARRGASGRTRGPPPPSQTLREYPSTERLGAPARGERRTPSPAEKVGAPGASVSRARSPPGRLGDPPRIFPGHEDRHHERHDRPHRRLPRRALRRGRLGSVRVPPPAYPPGGFLGEPSQVLRAAPGRGRVLGLVAVRR